VSPSLIAPCVKTELHLVLIPRSRSLRRTRDAANQLILVARGLEGSNFGYASVTM